MTSRLRFAAGSILLLAAVSVAAAQGDDAPTLNITRTDVVPRLDDFVDMALPAHLEGKLTPVPAFIQREPNDRTAPTFPTDIYIGYDDKHLHVIFVAFDDEPEKVRANMSPRDNVFDDDNLNIIVDTDNDQRRGYIFMSTPLGIQWEGQYTEGSGFDGAFDAVWHSEGRVTDRGYIVKMEIPFLSLRFPDTDEQTWRVIFNRSIPRLSEESYWPEFTREIEGRLNQAAPMTGIRDISPGRNMQLAPFGFFRDFRNEFGQAAAADRVDEGNEEAIGLDAKIVIKDALVLDLTANPDFSQVESDEPQVTVNERFEVFFPEQRPFFLENSDVFRTDTNLVFTRRIADPSAGVKLTGKQGAYSLGVMLADDEQPGRQAAAGDPLEGKSADVGVLRVTRDVGEQSRLGILLTDRELADGYNRVGAFDGRFKLTDNWTTTFQIAESRTRSPSRSTGRHRRTPESDGTAVTARLDRDGTHVTNHLHYVYTSPDFITELGFLGRGQRPGAQNLHNRVAYRFRPAESKLTAWGPTLFAQRVLDTDGNGLEWSVSPEIEWEWAGGTNLGFGYEHFEERLLPEEFVGLTVPTDYSRDRWSVDFRTRRFDRVGFGVELDFGSTIDFAPSVPELADFSDVAADMLWRPVSPLRVNFTFFRRQLDKRDGSGRIFTNTIGRARANWQFTKELSLRLIGEYQDLDAGVTSRTDDTKFLADVLVRYLWNPWRALYVGYTSNKKDYDEVQMMGPVVGISDSGRQVFVKFSYLFQL